MRNPAYRPLVIHFDSLTLLLGHTAKRDHFLVFNNLSETAPNKQVVTFFFECAIQLQSTVTIAEDETVADKGDEASTHATPTSAVQVAAGCKHLNQTSCP